MFRNVPPLDTFPYQGVQNIVKEIYLKSQKKLPPDVLLAIEKAREKENQTQGKKVLSTILKNYEVAIQTDNLVCQDTGTPICFIKIGDALQLNIAELANAIKRGVEASTREYDIRPNMVDPITRINTKTNTGRRSPVIHYDITPDANYLELMILPKGSGSESMSFLKMLFPSEGISGIKKYIMENVVESGGMPCPPTILGIGIGGSFDQCALLAKEAVVRPIGSHNQDSRIARLEDELLEMINKTGIGPMGLGGDVTALGVNIETAETHISHLPVAVNTQCWKGERAGARIYNDGRKEYIWYFGDKGRSEF